MFSIRALFVSMTLFGCVLLVSANEPQPPPKKTPPPKPNPQQQRPQQQLTPQQVQALQQQARRQIAAALVIQEFQLLNLQGMWNRYLLARLQMPLVPFGPAYAYLPNTLPSMTGYPTTTTPTTPATSMAGFSRELVLELAGTTTFSQLRPGSVTQYQPATSDALKAGQVINVLAKNDPTAEKPGTWSFPCQITAIDDGNPKTLTVMAKLDPAQGEFDPAKKIITAVTIKAQPAVAQK